MILRRYLSHIHSRTTKEVAPNGTSHHFGCCKTWGVVVAFWALPPVFGLICTPDGQEPYHGKLESAIRLIIGASICLSTAKRAIHLSDGE